MISTFEIIFRLFMATIIGGLIGMEREVSNRPAGLRTHVLVTLGATLIMLISIDGFNQVGVERVDPARMAAQVISGIGFLGAGTIVVRRDRIDGLTTAASLWVSAGIGLGIGTGYYLGSIVTGIIILLTLTCLKMFEKRFLEGRYKTLEVVASNRPGIIGEIGVLLGSYNISIKDIFILNNEDREESETMEIRFSLNIPSSYDTYNFYKKFYEIPGVENIIMEGEKISNVYG